MVHYSVGSLVSCLTKRDDCTTTPLRPHVVTRQIYMQAVTSNYFLFAPKELGGKIGCLPLGQKTENRPPPFGRNARTTAPGTTAKSYLVMSKKGLSEKKYSGVKKRLVERVGSVCRQHREAPAAPLHSAKAPSQLLGLRFIHLA